ncbi:nicotinamide N-methyltransferase-like [Ambystoma mexicanum]|uniref:nicotinamide N-methyltransferase-like n=1 Tax=Ambystoma mexicanum TaxID=8296 RepID=UPI0037E8754C
MQSIDAIKNLYDQHFSARKHAEAFYHVDCGFLDDGVIKQTEALFNIFSSGSIKGNTLLAFKNGPTIHELLPACELFKEITVSTVTDDNASELKKWVGNEPGAIDWSFPVKILCEHEGNGEKWMEKQETLRRAIKKILRSDLTNSNPLAPITLPLVDCLLSMHYLGCFYLEKNSYLCGLQNITSLLKTGGYLILVEALECTYFIVDTCRFPHICIDAEYVGEALSKAGYVIVKQVKIPRIDQELFETTDFTAVLITVARKEQHLH